MKYQFSGKRGHMVEQRWMMLNGIRLINHIKEYLFVVYLGFYSYKTVYWINIDILYNGPLMMLTVRGWVLCDTSVVG